VTLLSARSRDKNRSAFKKQKNAKKAISFFRFHFFLLRQTVYAKQNHDVNMRSISLEGNLRVLNNVRPSRKDVNMYVVGICERCLLPKFKSEGMTQPPNDF
jgi:hypothetical protein